MFKHSIIAVTLVVLLAACQTTTRNGQIKKQDVGTIAGALGGAFAGSNLGKGRGRTLGIMAGTLLGAYVGNQVGLSLDRADMLYLEQTSQRTLETAKVGETSRWVNPDSGNSGTITPVKTFESNSGRYCREFQQTITIGGKTQDAYGTACRQPDGAWEIQS